MCPNYGKNAAPGHEVVPDWLLGGNRKRLVLEALALRRQRRGWSAAELADELSCGPTTVFEILRALRPLGVLDELPDGRVRLSDRGGLARALRAFLRALRAHALTPVDRPPRPRNR